MIVGHQPIEDALFEWLQTAGNIQKSQPEGISAEDSEREYKAAFAVVMKNHGVTNVQIQTLAEKDIYVTQFGKPCTCNECRTEYFKITKKVANA